MSKTTIKFSPEVLERAICMVLITSRTSLAVGCHFICGDQDRCSPATLLEWVEKTQADSGMQAGPPTDVAEKMNTLERRTNPQA